MAVAFFIVAHSDDWFLFMGNAGLDAFGDGKNGNTICFVYVTATNFIDGTNVAVGDDVKQRYEQGLLLREGATINMMVDHFDAPLDFAVKQINGRGIAFYEVANTRHYCLRLADGIVDGSGVAWNGNQSLRNLKEKGQAMTAQGDIPATFRIVGQSHRHAARDLRRRIGRRSLLAQLSRSGRCRPAVSDGPFRSPTRRPSGARRDAGRAELRPRPLSRLLASKESRTSSGSEEATRRV